jgi:cell division protein FtsQ
MWDRPDILNAIANTLFAAAFVLLAFGALHFAVRLPLFPLHEVLVNGELGHTTAPQLEAIAKRELKGNFFTVDLAHARAVFEHLPWARRVSVRREWPDRLLIDLEEHVPLARWGDTALVDTYGEVFAAAYDGELPVFTGPQGSAPEITIQYEYFKRTLARIGRVPAQVQISARRAWEIRLDDKLVLELGREQLEERLNRFVSSYERTIAPLQRRIDYADLRYSNGFAVRIPGLKPEAQPAPKAPLRKRA